MQNEMQVEFEQIAIYMLTSNKIQIAINKPFLIDILQKFFLDNGEKFIMEYIPQGYTSLMKFRNSSDKLLCLYNELKANKIPIINCIHYFEDDFYLKSLFDLKLNYYV
jgi:hypothetical protein